ncbi:hypothetical protein OG21DRAFT_1481466 [Imleria badia]|nr:hypothetical protein OG21DRAFT_1481466 [Imleria badia]
MSSDDSDCVEIVDKHITDASRSGNNDICQLCPFNLHGLTVAERQDHYVKHNTGPHISTRATKRARPKPASVVTPQRKTTPMKFGKRSAEKAPEDIFWYPTQAEAPPDNYTPGVLSILKEALKQSHKKGATQRAVLCYERTPHILREQFDLGWGCGHVDSPAFGNARYRNFLMTCAALMDQPLQTLYFPLLDDPSPPGVRNLQRWLEDAWKQGYDDIGARHFDHKLVDTKEKVGTGDLYVAFTSRKIPCTLADFDLRKSPKGFDTLTEWVVNYFTEKHGDVNKILRAESPVVATGKMPVIMQYDGHSVTIVGYELAKNGKYNLLVFDPSSKINGDIRRAALNVSTSVDRASSSSVSLGKSKRRDQSKSPAPKKRSRTNQDPDDGVVSIPDSDEENLDNARRAVALKSTLDPDTVIKAFRLKGNKIQKKDDYQLLYFTMGDPLTDDKQNTRKVVHSIIEC